MILSVVISLLAILGFALVLWKSRIVLIARQTLSTTVAGLGAMMDGDLDDDAKEKAVKQAGIGLITSAFSIFWRFGAALCAAAIPIVLADATGIVASDTVLGLMLRLDYILVVSVLAIIVSEILRRRHTGASAKTTEANRYSAADRFFHIMAFSSPRVLKAASRLEDSLYSKAIRAPDAPPVFITSIARGGTTALLNAFHDIPGVATHIYRDMPLVTAPLLWNRLAGGQKRSVERHQRAHGDGLEIDLDSPEAFEEILWKMFWPEKFHGRTIALWDKDQLHTQADAFINQHFSKIVSARLLQGKVRSSQTLRYCSKNNANIARIPYLLKAFPGCRIVVPVRRPESHAASLLRQHKNFMKQQAEDEFIKRYMRDIGHFEFGRIHKPIAFPSVEINGYDPETGNYWLAYWINAFRHVLTLREQCIFVLQDDLRSRPQETLEVLCARLDLAHDGMDFTSYFRGGADTSPTDVYDSKLLEEATALYRDFEKTVSSG